MNISNTVQPIEVDMTLRQNKERPAPHRPETVEPGSLAPEIQGRNNEHLKAVLAKSDISLNFRTDEGSGRLVVEMIDNSTGEPVRQIPNEVSLRLSEMFSKVQGQLFEVRI